MVWDGGLDSHTTVKKGKAQDSSGILGLAGFAFPIKGVARIRDHRAVIFVQPALKSS